MSSKKHISYETILSAKRGDPEAMNRILRHYDSFFKANAVRELYDKYGNIQEVVDQEIYERIRAKVMFAIIYKFDPLLLPKGEVLED